MSEKMENYRQNIEGELAAMIFAIIGLFTLSAGIIWALVFAARWLIK